MEGIEPPTHTGYNVYSVALTIKHHLDKDLMNYALLRGTQGLIGGHCGTRTHLGLHVVQMPYPDD